MKVSSRKKLSYRTKLQSELDPVQRLYQVVEHGMCIGCGICQSLAGPENITMEVVENGTERPVVFGSITEQRINSILDICPGTKVEGLPESLVDEDSQYDEVWGIWRQMALAWSAEPPVRHASSTGGLLTSLGLYLIESGEVDFLLHASASHTNPTFGKRTISRTRQQVLDASGSRYGPTATLIDVVQILDQCQRNDERFAFIGTPCDVTALRNLAVLDPRVNQYCVYQLAMVCGGFMAPQALNRFLRAKQIDPNQVSGLRYRGYGCPGPTRVETHDGSVREFNYLDFWGDDESSWELPFRCKVCADGIGDSADIAASDSWDGGSPPRNGQELDQGFNAAIIRSSKGQQLFADAVAAGYVEVGKSVTPRDMDRFQPHQKAKKESVWARFVGMRTAGVVVPDVRGLRLKPLARKNSISENLNQARGTKYRCKAGKNRENKPIALIQDD